MVLVYLSRAFSGLFFYTEIIKMKKIFLFLLILISVASFGQDDTTSYTYYKNTYGNGFNRIQAKQVLRVPRDTIYTKTGWAELNGVPYWGDGTMWHKTIQMQLTSPLPGQNLILGADSSTLNNYAGAPSSGTLFSGIPTIIDNGNLSYFVNTNGPYKINGVPYPTSSGTVTLPVGNAGVDSGRIDEIVATAAGVGSIQGNNSDNPVAKDVDINTTLEIGTVLILADATTPATISGNLLVFDENTGSPTEFVETVTGATVNANSATNPFHGSKTNSITAFTAGQNITFTHTAGVLNKIDYTAINGYIKINNAWNAGTQYSVVLLNGAVITNSVPLTNWGIIKTTTGSYQSFSVPMSLFTGSPQFTGIRIIRTGTGGTTNWLLDYVQLQSSTVTIPQNNNSLIDVFQKPGTDSVFKQYVTGPPVFAWRLTSAAVSQSNEPVSYPTRIVTAHHTAFGVSMLKGGNIYTVEAEGVNHALTAGTVPVVFITTDRGKTNSKIYLPTTGISGVASNDLRNFSAGIDNAGTFWIIGADYIGASESPACRVWRWTSADGVTWSNPVQITYNTTTYSGGLTPYGTFHDYGTYKEFPAYGSGPGGSYAVMFKTLDNGATWAVKVIHNGNTSLVSDYITETDIIKTSGANLIAIARREDTRPGLYSSADDGETWTSRGFLSHTDSTRIHCPVLTIEANQVFAIWANRYTGTIEQVSVYSAYTDTASWNAQPIKVIASSIVQTGFGAIDFGYPSVISSGQNRIISYYDLGLLEPTPADINPAITDIIYIDAPVNPLPQFNSKMINDTIPAGTEMDIRFDKVTRSIDNEAMQQSNNKSLLIPEDGLYLISGGLRVDAVSFGAKIQLTCYRYNSSDISDLSRSILQDIGNIQGPCTPHINQTVYLRKGNYIVFRIYNGDSVSKPLDNDNQPFFSITKVKQ